MGCHWLPCRCCLYLIPSVYVWFGLKGLGKNNWYFIIMILQKSFNLPLIILSAKIEKMVNSILLNISLWFCWNSVQDNLYVIYYDSTFATEATKWLRLLGHLESKHLEKAGKRIEYFKILKQNLELCNINTFLVKNMLLKLIIPAASLIFIFC